MPTSRPTKMAASKEQDKGGVKKYFNFDRIYDVLKPKRPTIENILFWYGPIVGGISYVGFSAQIFNPQFLAGTLPQGRLILANCFLFNAHLGSGLYLYSSKHLSAEPLPRRVIYSAYGALMFNFGSILLWALSKSILPEDGIFRTVFGLSSSICLLLIGKEYISSIDNFCAGKK